MLLKTYRDLINDFKSDFTIGRRKKRVIGDLAVTILPRSPEYIKVEIFQGWRAIGSFSNAKHSLIPDHMTLFFCDEKGGTISMKVDQEVVFSELEKGKIIYSSTEGKAISYQIDRQGIMYKKTLDIDIFHNYQAVMDYLGKELLERFTDSNFPLSDLTKKRKVYYVTGKELRNYFPEDLLCLILEYRFN